MGLPSWPHLRDQGRSGKICAWCCGIIDGATSALWGKTLAPHWKPLAVRRLRSRSPIRLRPTTSKMGDVTFVARCQERLADVMDPRQARRLRNAQDTVRSTFEGYASTLFAVEGYWGRARDQTLDDLTSGLQAERSRSSRLVRTRQNRALGVGFSVCRLQRATLVSPARHVQSVEMDRGELVVSSARAQADRRAACDDGPAGERKWTQMTKAAQFLSALPVYIDATTPVTVFDIKGPRVRRHRRNAERAGPSRPAVVIVDYLQRVTRLLGIRAARGSRKLAGCSRVEATGEETKDLRRGAGSRPGEPSTRRTTRPLSDLHESGTSG